MPSVNFACPDCQAVLHTDFGDQPASAFCSTCDRQRKTLSPEYVDGQLSRCLICGGVDLFVRKDFPQRLGVAIVVIGFAASCFTWAYHHIIATFAILMGTALIDVLLYLVMGNVLECYRCHAQHRGLPEMSGYGAFDLEIHERHRQQKLRLNEARRSN